MRRMLKPLWMGALVAVAGPSGLAAAPQSGAVVALHARTPVLGKTNPCGSTAIPTVPCSQYTTTWPLLTSAFVYVTVARGDSAAGIQGLSMGVDYDATALYMQSWNLCADGLQIGNAGPHGEWPAPQGGIQLTWLTCNRNLAGSEGIHAVAGYFYVYAYSDALLRMTDNNNLLVEQELRVADCSPQECVLELNAKGSLGFGEVSGFNPCAPGSQLGLDPDLRAPPRIRIHAVAPNPTRSGVQVRFELSTPGPVRLRVLEVTGREVATVLGTRSLSAGVHESTWDGRDIHGARAAPGTYFLTLEGPFGTESRKLVLVR